MNLATLPIVVSSQRDAGTHFLCEFQLASGLAQDHLMALLEWLPIGGEISVPSPAQGEKYLDVGRSTSGFQVKHGGHGSHGTWDVASKGEAVAWLLPGSTSIETRRVGWTMSVPVSAV